MENKKKKQCRRQWVQANMWHEENKSITLLFRFFVFFFIIFLFAICKQRFTSLYILLNILATRRSNWNCFAYFIVLNMFTFSIYLIVLLLQFVSVFFFPRSSCVSLYNMLLKQQKKMQTKWKSNNNC